jgi:hypothetical protein
MNFCIYDEQIVLVPILSVEAFKPAEGKEGVFTSLEEWALCFVKPEQEFQLRGLYEIDDETKMHWERVIYNTAQATFSITDMDLTAASYGSESENKDFESLDTEAKRQQGKSNLELAKTVNNALKEYLDKAEKRITQAKTISPKELANIKVYNTRSAMTALVNTFHKKAWYHDFRKMHKGVIAEIKSIKKEKMF